MILLALADNSAIPLPGSMDVLTVLLSAHNRDWPMLYALVALAVLGGLSVPMYFKWCRPRKKRAETAEPAHLRAAKAKARAL